MFYDAKNPSGKACGGSGILIKNRIKHHVNNEYTKEYIHSISITITETTGSLTVSSIYCPPKYSITEQQFTIFLQSLGSRFIAAGDYNAKHTHWGSRLVTTRGKNLLSSVSKLGLDVISTGEPTYWPTDTKKIPDLIDFGIVKNLNRSQMKAESAFDLSSDHSPSIVTLNLKAVFDENCKTLTSKNTNWLSYRKYISSHINSSIHINSSNEIDSSIKTLTDFIIKAAEASTPSQNYVPRRKKITPTDVEHLIMEKRYLRRRFQNYRAPNTKRELNKCSKKLKKLLKENKDNNFKKYVTQLTPFKATDYSLWNACKSLKRPILPESPIRLLNGEWARTNEEKSKAFADHLTEVFTPYNFKTTLPVAVPSSETLYISFTLNEILNEIKSLNNRKSPGVDQITGQMMKELPKIAVLYLKKIFNSIIRIQYFPERWKLSLIITLLKPGKDPTNTNSYRPISLLPIMSKIFEKLLLNKLKPTIARNSLIPEHQFGFRNKHSTTEQVHRIVSEVRKTFEEKKYCSAVFLDVAQAFDKVWHTGLLHKLQTIFPENISKIFASYLNNRKFVVKYKDSVSRECLIKAGVPQGSVFGPLLYLLYTSDLPTNGNIITSTFADDTAFLSSNTDPKKASMVLQNHIKEVEEWMQIWRIKVNETKSTNVTFTLRKENCPRIKINKELIPEKTSVTYLGFHLDRRMTWNRHIKAKIEQMKIKVMKLNWLIGKRSPLNLTSKVLLYKAIIKPIWTYGIMLWGTASQTSINKIQRIQSKILRNITGAPWFIRNSNIHKDLQIPTINEEIHSSKSNYLSRLQAHPNPLAKNLLQRSYTKRLKRRDF